MKKTKKSILNTSIVITSIVVLVTIFGIADYNRVKNGKQPIFKYRTLSITAFNVCKTEEDCTTTYLPTSTTIHYGLGYKIIDCRDCEKSVYVMPLGIGNYPFEYLTCTENKNTYQHEFIDGKLRIIQTTLAIPAREIIDMNVYKEEMNKINNIKGCFGSLDKIDNTNYAKTVSCNLTKMSDEDIQTVYASDRDTLDLTRKELVKLYKKNDKDFYCELKH